MNAEEKQQGERMKATKVAICRFQALHPSSVSNSDSKRLEATEVQAYPISSKRHLQAMRSELDATVREVRRQVSLGYWPRRTYELLVEKLRGEGLIDISRWTDTDAGRMRKILENGKIRTTAQWRLATEYRDTVDDQETRHRIDDLIASYEAAHNVRREKSLGPRSASNRVGEVSKLTSDDIAFADMLRRSAVASYEYAVARDEAGVEDKRILKNRAEVWRAMEVKTRRGLKDMENGFWVSLSKLRNRLSAEQFQQLTRKLQEEGLVDISELAKPRNSRSRAR